MKLQNINQYKELFKVAPSSIVNKFTIDEGELPTVTVDGKQLEFLPSMRWMENSGYVCMDGDRKPFITTGWRRTTQTGGEYGILTGRYHTSNGPKIEYLALYLEDIE